MSGIFLSYRRNDAPGHAGRLYDRLIVDFGKDRVFRDLDSLTYGTEFLQAIREAISTCDSLVAVIGREWLRVSRTGGGRRLDDPRDFVRLEIAAALERGIPVIPVLVEEAEMPSEADLPVPLVRLTRYNGLEVSDSRWNHDVGQLVTALGQWTPTVTTAPGPAPVPAPVGPQAPGRTGRPLVPIVAGIGLLAVVGLLGLLLRPDGGSGAGGPPPSRTRTMTVSVPGTQFWTDSGVDVATADRVGITATGIVFSGGSDSAGPDGAANPDFRVSNVVMDANHAGLIGRVGESGAPFNVGSESSFPASATGRLYLGINDKGLDNNRGAFTVTVEVAAAE